MEQNAKSDDKTSLLISAKKYSTIAEFQEDIDNIRNPPQRKFINSLVKITFKRAPKA